MTRKTINSDIHATVIICYYWWHELPQKIRTSARDLGYDENSWDSNLLIDINYLDWNELSSIQRSDIQFLCYSKRAWYNYSGKKKDNNDEKEKGMSKEEGGNRSEPYSTEK